MAHISVLSDEVLKGLNIRENDTVLDATVNGGGHSERIAQKLGGGGILIGVDMDSEALDSARERLLHAGARVVLKEGNFRDLDVFLREEHITNVDKFLFDLGISSRQLDESTRGFSFRSDAPLLMTFSPKPSPDALTAREIVNAWEEESIRDILSGYGEERYARRIAHAIAEARTKGSIKTTGQLVEVVRGAVPKRYESGRIHFATRTFQALRMTVNDEIESLREGLAKAFDALSPRGRIAVITFHSIEDRIVKRTFKQFEDEGGGVRITKRPIRPSEEEVKENPRSRSAKLRIFEKHAKEK